MFEGVFAQLSPLEPWWPWIAAALGAIVGSFLNVVILRLPLRLEWSWRQQAREFLGEPAEDIAAAPPGLVMDHSRCPSCQAPIRAWQNIPVISWLLLRGRCASCRTAISWQYPLVELLTALASLAVALKFGFTFEAVAALGFTWTLVALCGIDFRTQLLPDQLTLCLLWAGLLLALQPLFVGPAQAILGAALGYLSLWSVFWLFRLATGKEGMGYGDFKLLAALGAWLGPMALLPIVLIASLSGAVIGGIYLAVKHGGESKPFAFGPYLAIAGWIQLIAGDWLLARYYALLGM
ncbi:prepilin peptidase [Pseudofulvimonas gallinarii]|jgi:leader peptidase (prepilin peptidase)/N-methyltransferase|uniref:Prepilin leader peptidase/N-methyltransferase n=1 Tax=Pseudofulvimonas gallinarii TaxID=634155 RepID=A0A4S3KXZ9_9GAMM|nr:A24 family peptidase [Pseudofulvimonas gallinarii]TCS93705.1 leader peptidase (prepilin peptidase)/N-methyltransferase [Pseudofulvimonas gallinarii]THD14247.1 prepilin peptidase [Pseudofulvimonas gallinarii]